MTDLKPVQLSELPTPEDAVEAALATVFADHEDEPYKGAVIICTKPDGSYFYTYSHNLNDAQIHSMASYVSTVQALAFMGESEDE